MNHYGLGSFKFQVIELCGRTILLVREQEYLDLLFATVAPALIYNFAINALAPFTGRTHTAEAKAAISEAHQGKAHSAETKAAMSAAHLGTTHSAETKVAIGAALSKAVYVYDENNVLVDTFPSQSAAIKEYNISKGSIYRYLDSKKLWNNLYYFTSTPLAP
jgi:group I intron endonuclease